LQFSELVFCWFSSLSFSSAFNPSVAAFSLARLGRYFIPLFMHKFQT
jgi:hypothetical protein